MRGGAWATDAVPRSSASSRSPMLSRRVTGPLRLPRWFIFDGDPPHHGEPRPEPTSHEYSSLHAPDDAHPVERKCGLSVRANTQEHSSPYQPPAPTPPMGWNSWDSYGLTITEVQFQDNVGVLAQTLKPHGWRMP